MLVMAAAVRNWRWVPAVVLVLCCCSESVFRLGTVRAQNYSSLFQDNYEAQWGGDHVRNLDNGQQAQLVLDVQSGGGFQSIITYTYGFFSMSMKLIPGNSAGTVTAFYLSSGGDAHDEIDFEFLGNTSGQPYILQTNVFANGTGGREQRTFLWFDPTADFHNYSVIWNHAQISFFVDNAPIRIFRNLQSQGVAYPSSQQMGVYSALFEASSWATLGGQVPIDWNAAPFVATYAGFGISACVNDGTSTQPSCATNYETNWWEAPEYTSLGAQQVTELKNVRQSYLVYDYCYDRTRYPTVPIECASNYGT